MNNLQIYPYNKEIEGLVLDRFLPPCFENGIDDLLNNYCQPGDMLFDPFGSHPLFPLLAAKQGYTVLVNSHNPIINTMMRTFALSPSVADFNKGLADFSSLKRGEEFLEQHLKSLYETKCPICNEITPATAFLWQKNESAPYKKIISCVRCHNTGEYDIDAYDISILEKIGTARLHHSRALSSVVDPNHENYAEIEQMLDIFPLRSLYTIINMSNRIKGTMKNPQSQQLLTALLINFCDYGNALWDPENANFRPKQINLPSVYKEYNPWLLIGEWIQAWKQFDSPIPYTIWPEFPDKANGGICLMPFRLKDSIPLIKDLPLKAIIGLVPRPSNAFWTLSAIWSGWIYGKSAVQDMLFAFTRKRYDWKWHANALSAGFKWINQSLADTIPRILQIPELSPGFLSAIYAAAHEADWYPESTTFNSDDQNMFSVWKRDLHRRNVPVNFFENIQTIIQEINEPVPYMYLHHRICLETVLQPFNHLNTEFHGFQNIQENIERVLINNPTLKRVNEKTKEKKSGYWWLKSVWTFNNRLTYSEVLENETFECFQHQEIVNEQEFFQYAAGFFPGSFSPPRELMQDCLQAYGYATKENFWHISEMDQPEKRQEIIRDIVNHLCQLGKELNFDVEKTIEKVLWKRENKIYRFHIIKTGICSPYMPLKESENEITAIIFPGSKSKLVHYRLEHDPRYQQAAEHCYLIKFRHILRLFGEQTHTNLDLFLQSLREDQPGLQDMRQMTLFNMDF
jgi:hypothetical protein